MSKIYVDEILPKDNATVDGSNLSIPASAISSLNSSAMPSGVVIQVKHITSSFGEVSVASASWTPILTGDITVQEGSRVALWFDSGQISLPSGNTNPNIKASIGGNYITNDMNHRWYPGFNGGGRVFLNNFGLSPTLAAGTYAVALDAYRYNTGTVIYNHQNQKCTVMMMEIAG